MQGVGLEDPRGPFHLYNTVILSLFISEKPEKTLLFPFVCVWPFRLVVKKMSPRTYGCPCETRIVKLEGGSVCHCFPCSAFIFSPRLLPFLWRFSPFPGVVSTNGERWRQLRRFSLTTLRNFGMGKRSIEERIQEEAQFLVEALRKTEGHPFDPTFYLSHAVSNVICFVVFGQRFEYEDKQFVFLLDVINKSFRLVTSAPSQMKNFFPGLMRILPGPHQEGPKYMKELINFISQRVQIHRESFDPNCPRDFIDCFLAKMEQEKENPTSEFHNENLAVTVLNLFFAGTETVSTTLRYGLLILLRYPEIEAKVQEEIDRVIGRNRSPSLEQCFPTFFGQRHTCFMKKISRHTTMPDGERSLFTYLKKIVTA
uniref:Uncharacterized protein n=1 Tax=Podarcis muralis TaxID=64176 RepID=A0A670INR8_PODMU